MTKRFAGQKILIGITGGIAAYKILDLISELKQMGAQVRIILTRNAQKFVTPLSCQALSGHPVCAEAQENISTSGMDHIELAKWADWFLIAPASANVLAKVAHGLADDILTSTWLASPAKKLLVPAMNQHMWLNPATVANLTILQTRNIAILGPAEGLQACGDIGPGRLVEVPEILAFLLAQQAERPLANCNVLITAGPTREAIDPIRYLSNYSSGKMGYALAAAAQQAGAEVCLISGPTSLTCPENVTKRSVTSAKEMYDQVLALIKAYDIFISAAAVADYQAKTIAHHKISKDDDEIQLNLVKTPDIASAVANLDNGPFAVGFAAQTDALEHKALQKLQIKNLDLIIANDVSRSDIGFHSDDNEVIAIWQTGKKHFPKMRKSTLATALIALITEQYHAKTNSSKNFR